MGRTAIIYDVAVNYEYTGEPTDLGFLGSIASLYKRRKYSFIIQYPDNSEEEVEYCDCDPKNQRPNKLHRERTLQEIVNKLENDGYRVFPDQLALFMSGKIDKLIMQKNASKNTRKRGSNGC